MLLTVPKGISMWEAVVAEFLATSLGTRVVINEEETNSEPANFFSHLWGGGLIQEEESFVLDFNTAYRKVESSKEFYPLAETNGFAGHCKLVPLSIPQHIPSETGGIIVCLESITSQFNLPVGLWSALVRHLRSYGLPVQVMLSRGSRPPGGLLFTENDILSALCISDKLDILANARCIVGLPNAWTWLGTAWSKKTIVFQPDVIPERRWWPYSHENLRMFLHPAHNVKVPVFLTYMRKVMKQF